MGFRQQLDGYPSNNVVRSWSDATPQVVLQTYESIYATDARKMFLLAPDLKKTPTKNKWFYNESDGYFYYVGVLNHNDSVPAPLDVGNPINSNVFFREGPSDFETPVGAKDFTFRMYGETLEANTQAVADLWGLTYEPGSLGAAIFN